MPELAKLSKSAKSARRDDLADVAVMLSGSGSNLAALLEAKVPVRLVVSDHSDAHGLALARKAKLNVAVLERDAFPSRKAYEGALGDCLEAYQVRLVVLAGFMRVLGSEFCERFAGRLVNLHPSLLPDLPGLDTHRRALQAGLARHGCSVHWVTPELDGGPVIRQASVPILPGDDEQSLCERVQAQEHVLLPAVVNDILAGKESLT